jgi:RHS repeat-associated protein
MVVSLHLRDAPAGYRPPVGLPVFFIATYNQREAGQPVTFNYSNLGPKWTFNWLAYIKDNPSATSSDVSYYTDGGGSLPFSGFDTNTQTFAPQIKSQALLKRTSTNSYEMSFRDGSKIIFAQPDSIGGTSRRVFMTQKIDPRGNAVQIDYDGSFRVTAITDAIGQITTFAYTHPTDTRKITKVTDPFGRFASFTYDVNNRLSQITDVIGLTSQFTYDSGDFIQALTTPYGTTSFEKGENGRQRWLVTTHPNGEKERVEYNEYPAITGIAAGEPAAKVPIGMGIADSYLNYRNSFYWDRKAYAEAVGDYNKARLYHWLHFGSMAGGIVESEKMPLENRVWYTYDGQSVSYQTGTTDQPNAIGRVLDDGTTQLRQFSYDSVGNVTNTIDPVGRSMSYIYATNLVDLLEIRQTTSGNNDLIARFIYNTQHLAIAAQAASGHWTTNTYNNRGQLTSTRNPLGETIAFSYDANGYLLTADGALPGTNDSLNFTYDSFGRPRTVTDADGFSITNSYDNLDRLTNIAFMDGTFAAFTYDKLDRAKTRDRQGREVTFTYDSLRRLTSMRDMLNRVLRFDYCNCGSLSSLTDPLGRITRWEYDLQGRLSARQFPDGSRVLYSYENTTSRVKTLRDEQGQITLLDYFNDDLLRRISYPTANVATPASSFTYDPSYPRIQTRMDGLGKTMWTYEPVGAPGALNIASVDGPWPSDTVAFQYDGLDRQISRAINGVAQRLTLDNGGRVTGVTNALGSFGVAYDGVTDRVLDLTFPNGQTTHLDYFNNIGNRRLQRITHRRPDTSVISQFTYARNAAGGITNWLQELGSVTNNWSAEFDAADRLMNVLANQNGTNVTSSFGYDLAGNRLSENVGASNRVFQYNALNQPTSSSDNSPTNTTYEWDAARRLVAINSGSQRTELSYDGQGRRCRIVEKTNGVVQAERRYIWCGTDLCEERDANNAVLRRFFGQGFTEGGTNYFYTRDHLRSVREVMDVSGQVQSRYAYAPFGARTVLQENVTAPFAFGGYFRHEPSGLSLTLFRPYSTSLGRWLSRDPLSEAAGANLYSYANNDPINYSDSLGLCAASSPNEFKQGFFDLSNITGFADSAWGSARDLLRGAGNLLPDGNSFRNAFNRLPDAKWLGNIDLALNALNLMDNPTLGKTLQMELSLAGEAFPPVQWFNRGMTFGQLGTQALYNYAVGQVGQNAIDTTLADWGDNWFWQGVNRASDVLNQPMTIWGGR